MIYSHLKAPHFDLHRLPGRSKNNSDGNHNHFEEQQWRWHMGNTVHGQRRASLARRHYTTACGGVAHAVV
jgi:hypothetical protein